MAEYIVQKPVDFVNLTAKAKKTLPAQFDITPKYDGCCAVMAFDSRGRYFGTFSATGEVVMSMDHIGPWVERMWPIPLRDRALVGEAWMPGADFPTINGTFRRKRVQPELRFAPFDCVAWTPGDSYPLLGDERSYHERASRLSDGVYSEEYLIPVPHSLGDLEAARRAALHYKAAGGFDGAIVRDQYAPYIVGRSKSEVIKIKPTLSLDLVILRTDVAPGAKTGRPVYTLVVEHRGVTTFVGSGVPHVLSWATGDIVEVECMGLTPDGKLREPRFKGIRYDKVGPDA